MYLGFERDYSDLSCLTLYELIDRLQHTKRQKAKLYLVPPTPSLPDIFCLNIKFSSKCTWFVASWNLSTRTNAPLPPLSTSLSTPIVEKNNIVRLQESGLSHIRNEFNEKIYRKSVCTSCVYIQGNLGKSKMYFFFSISNVL